jgi:hypothetical protein
VPYYNILKFVKIVATGLKPVRRPFLDCFSIGIRDNIGAAVLADILGIMAVQTVTFANGAVLDLASCSDFEAFLHTAFGLQLGHFGLLWLSPYQVSMAALIGQPTYSEAARITGREGNASDSREVQRGIAYSFKKVSRRGAEEAEMSLLSRMLPF